MKKTKKPSYFLWLFQYLKPYKTSLVWMVVLLFFAMGAAFSVPFLNSFIVNRVIPDGDYGMLTGLLVACLLLMLTESTITFVESRMMAKAGMTVAGKIREEVFEKLQGFPLSFYETKSRGDLLQRTTNYVDELSNFLSNYAIVFVSNIFKVVVVLIFMLTLSWQLALVVFGALAINFCFLLVTRKILGKRSKNVKIYEARRSDAVIENINGMLLTLAYNRTEQNLEEYGKVLDDYTGIWMRFVKVNELFQPGVEMLWYYGSIVVYVVSFLLLKEQAQALTLGAVVAFSGYVTQMTTPLIQLGIVLQQVGVLEGACANIFEILSRKQVILEKEGAQAFTALQNEMEWKDVSLGKGESLPIRHLSFTVRKGEIVGICGENEKALHLIAKLLMRHLDVTEGSITLDGTNIKDLKLASIRKNIVAVDSEGYIFHTTVLDNIRYAKANATEEECIDAAKRAGAHEFIARLRDGYETVLEEKGEGLSNGEKQLISLARLLLHSPEIYVFMEAAGNIGKGTKDKILKTLTTELKDKTRIIIGNDEDMLGVCDRVIRLEETMV